MKSSHRNQIYRYLYHNEKQPQQKIAADLGLSMPTLAGNLNSLKEAGLITDAGSLESTGGRKARAWRTDPVARLALGLDITANHISLVIIDMKGHILHSNRIRHHFTDSYSYYSTLGKFIENFVEKSRVDRTKILGLGVCLSAIISPDHKEIKAARLFDAPPDLYQKLAPHIAFPFKLYNDANSGGFAEWWDQESDRTIIYLSLSNSVGGAMVTNRNLYTGENQRSCEFGHVTLVPDGKLCYCGQKGCVNAYLHAGLLSDMTDGKMDLFFHYVEEEKEPYHSAFREYLRYLAIAVNNLRMHYDCDVILGGYVGSYMEPYLEDFREMVRSRNRFGDDGRFVSACRHRYETAAIGAGLNYIEEFIKNI